MNEITIKVWDKKTNSYNTAFEQKYKEIDLRVTNSDNKNTLIFLD